jgi:hypothetical protein
MIVCLDANIVIYYVERDPIWEPKVSARFSQATFRFSQIIWRFSPCPSFRS